MPSWDCEAGWRAIVVAPSRTIPVHLAAHPGLMKTICIIELVGSDTLWSRVEARAIGERILEQSAGSDEFCLDFEGLALLGGVSAAWELLTPLIEHGKRKGRSGTKLF